jgi:hypothetical protein
MAVSHHHHRRKSTTVEIARCVVCRKKFPRPFLNLHHRQPREAGGGDEPGNQVWLCAGCHQNMHRLVEMIMRGEGGVAADSAATIYHHPKLRKVILDLAREAAYFLVRLQELGVVKTALTAKTVSLELDGSLYHHLRTLATQTRGPRGLPLTVPAYLKLLIRRHLANPLF